MHKAMLGCFMVLTAWQVFADGIGLQPGLWESRIIKQTRDGKDMTAQMNAAVGQMQERLASLPPDQREKYLALMKQSGGGVATQGSNGAIQMCVTADMAREDKPPMPHEGCQPSTIQRNGNHSTFAFSCDRNGTTTTGKGETTKTGDVISMVMDITTQRGTDSHVTHSETEMRYVGADCGDVKPISQMTAPKASP
jgi:hypothetical protein